MYTSSKDCPRRDTCVQSGKGLIHFKDLATQEDMHGHSRMFSCMVIDPGCSTGYHSHDHETEFYYILSGEGVFNDNGCEIIVHQGDVCSTGHGQYHSIVNRTDKPLEILALIIMEPERAN